MQLLQELLRMIWELVAGIFAAIIGPFTRALSVRRVDDGSGP